MLSGYFENCYGIKQLTLPNIQFNTCNKAMIYAPNGVMKTSFAKIFEDIARGTKTIDRIFSNAQTSYSVVHYTSRFVFPPAPGNDISKSENIYVINSFADKFEFTRETVSTLLADEATRNEYNVIMARLGGIISEIENKLRELTGLTKPQIKGKLIQDLNLESTSDWPDIIEAIQKITSQSSDILDSIKYVELFSDKAMAIYDNSYFRRYITDYIDSLETLLQSSTLLSNHFTEHSAEELGKSLASNNLFDAKHRIVLRDGTAICSLGEWQAQVQEQLKEIYQTPALASTFEKLKKLFTKNADALKVRDIIIAHREIIPLLHDISSLKLQVWRNSFDRLDRTFDEYCAVIGEFKTRIHALYEQASEQSERWETVVEEFNRRFKVPFRVIITNKSNFILKDEAPSIEFEYSRSDGGTCESTMLKTEEMKDYLSMGERRALYLLYILFDVERIRLQAEAGGGQYLIIADDISDSFDYKNKYAIIEYLNDLANTTGIDLLVLTHNFDFYRTVKLRLNVVRQNCFIAQKNEEGSISLSVFRYQKDFFKNVIRASIESGNINNNEKKKCLIASIPFYRNLTEYSGNDQAFEKLTCYLHYKSSPQNTEQLMVSDLWAVISPYLNSAELLSEDARYLDWIYELAKDVLNDADEISLENKLVISIAARLEVERFMKHKIIEHLGECADASSNQTREWFNKAREYLTDEEIELIEEINLITPESIHLNAFMFEPLIDVSIWNLKDLYRRALLLLR